LAKTRKIRSLANEKTALAAISDHTKATQIVQ